MPRPPLTSITRAVALLLTFSAAGLAAASPVDHREFDATLHVPYRAEASVTTDARTFTLKFEYPFVEQAQLIAWRLELLDPNGVVVQRWHGVEKLLRDDVTVTVDWAGRQPGSEMGDGVYQVRLLSTASDDGAAGRPAADATREFVEQQLAAPDAALIDQSWDMLVGTVASAKMPAFTPLLTNAQQVAATAAQQQGGKSLQKTQRAIAINDLPYTVYLSNLHSQTNHSDGGGNLASCSGAQAPQSAAFGPVDAFNYAYNRGLDVLMTSEHNHMYDGSDGTNTAQSPAFSKNLFQTGLSAAANFNVTHPNFLAIYGMEWGVINNGGHMNILNSTELFGWEYNSKSELLADVYTEKNNYGALYTAMRQRGLVGQFNHPDSSGQYLVNGVAFGYTADGEEAMALCEIANSSAFSVNTTETETSRSNYEGACKKALEAGFRVAFSTNQDNHCANWGASYTNRTGVLIPTGTALSQASFISAIKARRVFATFDKNSQLILTANGRLMGESFSNAGPLALVANFANSAGRTATTVQIYEGVPKRNGTVTLMSSQAVNTFTPTIGAHFYYAKVTQDDGKTLWSAPVWVNQTADTTAPTVAASVSGSSGTIKLAATASDNVAVTQVQFQVDGSVKGSSSTAPYALNLDSTQLANGSHTLNALAFDAAGNVGNSGSVGFSVSNVADVSAGVRFVSSGLTLNRATQQYTGTITVSNPGAALNGPLQLVLNGLPAGVTLANATGSRAGAPYLTVNAAGLAAGASLTLTLNFTNPSKLAVNYSAQLFSGAF